MLCILMLACPALVQFSRQRARQAADVFLGPLVTQLDRSQTSLNLAPWSRKTPVVSWMVYYEQRIGFADPLVINVDLRGRVVEANTSKLDQFVGLPDRERWELMEAELGGRR